MSKKVGIITLNGYFNYGNRLQNYAVEQVLKSLGFEVKTIINHTSTNRSSNKNILDKISTLESIDTKKIMKEIKNKAKYYLNKRKIDNYKTKKRELFKKFSADYLNETDYSISKNNIPDDFSDRFDYFVTGSDQVWNPYYIRRHSSINFLTFASKEKRIAFAPSFGVSKIPLEDKKNFKKWISEMNMLSVREYEGSKIIKDLTGREAEVLVDPTMVLKRKNWLSLSKEDPQIPDNDYLMTYILGELSREKKKEIRNFAKKNDLDIVDLAVKKGWSDYIVGPKEFIDYINSASAIFTDSFHGTIFSILFKTPFVTFRRRGSHSMISRINTLFSKFDMKDRLEDEIKLTKNEVMDIDFSHTDEILEKERKKTYDYLEKALDIK